MRLRDGLKKAGQFCIDSQLVAALKGDVNKACLPRQRKPAVRPGDPAGAGSDRLSAHGGKPAAAAA